MGDSLDDDSEPEWLRQAAHASSPAAPLVRGSRLSSGRFTIEEHLGRGGMGVVYAANDAERGERVALKTLPEARPEAVYRIKQEFRSLADVRHPNLVELHGLFEDAGRWFFTMSLVEGEPLDRHLARASTSQRSADAAGRWDALRDAFAQLATAVEAIHRAGKLHRDLKPANVLCTPEGRIVVLDFGLAADPEAGGVGQTVVDAGVSGTPGYMAPEQAAGRSASEASDWYAFGAMLYEALSGQLPLTGSGAELLLKKQTQDPEPLPAHAMQAPTALQTLCMELLRRDPTARPGASAVREALGEPAIAPPAVVHGATGAEATDLAVGPFFGRVDELAALGQALVATDGGRPVRVLIEGPSGVGKSTLVERFVASLEHGQPLPLVLSGRCYEREAVPFNAFDRLIDALSRHLRKLPEAEARALLPLRIDVLAALFPALGRLEVARATRRRGGVPDAPDARRTLAFAALRELMSRIAAERPLLLCVDDLQWGDADSAKLLAELLAPPDPPALLFVGTYRDDEREGSAFFEKLDLLDASEPLLDRRTLRLSNLSLDDASALAGALGVDAERAARIARESGGHPLFVQTLSEAGASSGDAGPDLDTAIGMRLSTLSPDERKLVTLLALSARPTERAVLLSAAELGAEGHALIDGLTERRLLRVVAADGGARLLCYHDRIREVAGLSAEARRDAHAALARALGAREHGDPEVLVEHLLEAGETARAVELAERAARSAGESLAFDLSARLFGLALEHGAYPTERAAELWRERARMFHGAMRPRLAASAYDTAARLGGGTRAWVDQACAVAELYDVDTREAVERLTPLALELGVRREALETGPQPIASGLTQERALAAYEVFAQPAASPSAVSDEDRQRLQALSALTCCVAPNSAPLFPVVQAYIAFARKVRLYPHTHRAAMLLAITAQAAGLHDARDRLLELVRDSDDGQTRAWAHVLHAAIAVGQGDVAAVRDHGARAIALCEAIGSGPLNMARQIRTFYLRPSEHRELIAQVRQARERGADAWAERYEGFVAMYLVNADESEAALRCIRPVRASELFEIDIHVYRTDLTAVERRLGEVPVPTAEELKADATHLAYWYAVGLLARAASGREVEASLSLAESLLELIRGVATASNPAAYAHHARYRENLLDAQIAHLWGEPQRARDSLQRVVDDRDVAYDPCGTFVAKRRLGELIGGERGAAMVAEADRDLTEAEIKNPARYATLWAPAFGLLPPL